MAMMMANAATASMNAGLCRRVGMPRSSSVSCSVFRDDEGLALAAREMRMLKEQLRHIKIRDRERKFNTELMEAIELGHLATLGEVIARSAHRRQESRRAHFRKDNPVRDDNDWLKHTFAFRREGGMEICHRPVCVTRFQPEERTY